VRPPKRVYDVHFVPPEYMDWVYACTIADRLHSNVQAVHCCQLLPEDGGQTFLFENYLLPYTRETRAACLAVYTAFKARSPSILTSVVRVPRTFTVRSTNILRYGSPAPLRRPKVVEASRSRYRGAIH